MGRIGIGCWIDWLELTICIFVEGILHPRVEGKQVLLLIGNLILIFPVTLSVLFKKLPYVVINGADNPLDYMKRIDDRNCV